MSRTNNNNVTLLDIEFCKKLSFLRHADAMNLHVIFKIMLHTDASRNENSTGEF